MKTQTVRTIITKAAGWRRMDRLAGLPAVVMVLGMLIGCAGTVTVQAPNVVRPPSTPLVACDPYFSIWSGSDTLAGDVTRHWTNRPHPLTALVRIDGRAFRLMGNEPNNVEPLNQTGLTVLPTQTIYTFEGSGVGISMTFLQAALPDDIDLLSRPVVWLTWECKSLDGAKHNVSVYLDAAMDIVVNNTDQAVVWSREPMGNLEVLKAGSEQQAVLGRKGDDVRIDWGYLYLAAKKQPGLQSAIAPAKNCRIAFVNQSQLPALVDREMPRAVQDNGPVLALQFTLAGVTASPQTCQAILAYDDIYSVLYFGQQLAAYWKKDGKTIDMILADAASQYGAIARRCAKFDRELLADLRQAGGAGYETIGTLAYRQALAANKIVADKKGMPLMFSKENFSNGCMGTVDVFYPFAPQVLLFNPTLAKASFVPILEYARSERWKFPFAPHDIGTYPHAMGQAYGGGERTEENQMPVEECGNMMLLVAGVVAAENDIAFARQYWDVLTVWAGYLKSKGLDPENQLCTDDFAGHLAHNVNLSLKALVALGAYAQMADRMGEKAVAAEYRKTAEQYVTQWMEMADNGDHYRLAFDRPDTWSQKYNLIWDSVLGLNLFPMSVAQKEMAYYQKMQKTYGLPLDNRSNYTKLDWIVWTASITNNKADFEALIAPVVKFLNETPDRVPMTDWYWTHDGKMRGFQARPVVGGVFIRLLQDRAVWSKWVKRADSVKGTWAVLPKPPKIVEVTPSSMDQAQDWRYTVETPAAGWFGVEFDATGTGWKQGPGGFGTRNTPGAVVRTVWNQPDIWLRRDFELTAVPADVQLLVHHDEDATIYINGVQVAHLSGYTSSYDPFPLTGAAHAALKTGKNTIAIHCHQTGGGQYIDAGLVRVIDQN